MRNIKRLFLIVSTFLFAIALASCDNTKRNTATPMGDINGSTVIASAGEYKLTDDVFYSQLRYQGYNTVINKIKSNLFEEEISKVKASFNFTDSEVNDYERELFDSYASAIYGTTSIEAIKDMKEEDLKAFLKQVYARLDIVENGNKEYKSEQCVNDLMSKFKDLIRIKKIKEEKINKELKSKSE